VTGRASILVAVALALFGELATPSVDVPARLRGNARPAPAPPKLLLWNASASVPRGLYLLRSAMPLQRDELVAVAPPAPLAKFLATRGYLPIGVPLLKHIAALSGQTVCRTSRAIFIDEHAFAFARDRDHLGRTLPTWKGCRTLRAGEVFLLNVNVPDSFDGRYFGPVSTTAITARAEPLWTIRKD
jgi:conjugative transfer signal peptidase TraF